MRDAKYDGRFQNAVTLPGPVQFGTWSLYDWSNNDQQQHGARLVPDRAPWSDLFRVLDELGGSLSGEPVLPSEEADAIVAACWRYGSYMHVLTSGETFSAFRADPQLSRFSNSEMMRINLEFSSGLSDWLQTRSQDPSRIWRRVRAIQSTLRLPWRTDSRDAASVIELFEQVLERDPGVQSRPTVSLREEANALVCGMYRGGLIEDLHAGRFNRATEVPGYKRIYANEVRKVGSATATKLCRFISVIDRFGAEMSRTASIATGGCRSNSWSISEETSPVVYLGMPGEGSLESRLAWLAEKDPALYQATVITDLGLDIV